MDSSDLANVHWFFDALEPFKDAYHDPEFAYILRRHRGKNYLMRSQLLLSPLRTNTTDLVFEAGGFFAFRGSLSRLETNARELVNLMLSGSLPVKGGVLNISLADVSASRSYIVKHDGNLSELYPQQQIHTISAHSIWDSYYVHDDDTWALRSGSTPFSDFSDLTAEVGLSAVTAQFQAMALPPILVDATSRIDGETGNFKVFLSSKLKPEKAKLGIIVRSHERAPQRLNLTGSQFEWKISDYSKDVLVGHASIDVPKASVAHCIVSYEACPFHHYWIGDPDASQNPLRSILETFDPQLEVMQELLTQQAKRGAGRDYEAAVGWMLWILGFAPLHLGVTNRLSDTPDVVAFSADGHIVVIECTLSSLKTDNKVQKLIDRTSSIQKSLDRSNAAGVICIPVMITPRRREEIQDEVEECERRGVVVYTHEDIAPVLTKTIIRPQSQVRFKELRNRLDQAVLSHKRRRADVEGAIDDVKIMKQALSSLGDDA